MLRYHRGYWQDYIVPHGDYYHYIPKNELSEASWLLQSLPIWSGKSSNSRTYRRQNTITLQEQTGTFCKQSRTTNTNTSNNSNTNSQASQSNDIDSLWNSSTNCLWVNDIESDGLVFDPAQITSRTARGVAVPHGDHYHFIPLLSNVWIGRTTARIIPRYRSNHWVPDSQNNQVHNRPEPRSRPATCNSNL